MKITTMFSILLLFISFEIVASDLNVIKYGYGLRGRDSSEYEKLVIHPLDYQINDSVFNFQGGSKNNKFNVSIALSVEQENSSVIGIVNIKNLGSEIFYIKYIDPSLRITTGNIMLDYLGALVDYGGDFEKSEWTEFPPGKELLLTIIINNNYEFFADKKYYDFVTSKYEIVNDKWFLEHDIYELLFSSINLGAYDCDLVDNPRYIYLKRFICVNYHYYEGEIKNMFNRFNFDGISKDNQLFIKSNQVNIEVNGSKLKSLYDRNN